MIVMLTENQRDVLISICKKMGYVILREGTMNTAMFRVNHIIPHYIKKYKIYRTTYVDILVSIPKQYVKMHSYLDVIKYIKNLTSEGEE